MWTVKKTNANNSLSQAPFYKFFHPYTLLTSFENFSWLSCAGTSLAVPNDRGFLSVSVMNSLLEKTSFQPTHVYQYFLQFGSILPMFLPSKCSSHQEFFCSFGIYFLQVTVLFHQKIFTVFFSNKFISCSYLLCNIGHIGASLGVQCMGPTC